MTATTDGPTTLLELLRTDTRDVGCERSWWMIPVYAEIVLAGKDPWPRLPGVCAHLAACPPCDSDARGLAAGLRELPPAGRTGAG